MGSGGVGQDRPPGESSEVATLVTIKGTKSGLMLHLDEAAPFSTLQEALKEKLHSGEGFYRRAKLNIDLGTRHLDKAEVEELLATLRDFDIEVAGLLADKAEARATLRDLGLKTRLPTPAARQETVETPEQSVPGFPLADALFIHRTIRSGQSVRHHRSVCIIGDINPGGEVIAGGDVVVWGSLRGLVYAGSLGDEKAVVCAIHFAPTQLRIASLLTRPPDSRENSQPVPEMARIVSGRIVVDPWSGGRNRR